MSLVDFSYVSPVQWNYFKATYGACPAIQLTVAKESQSVIDYKIDWD